MRWRFLDTGSHTAQENMTFDRELLSALHKDDEPLLHFYTWKEPSFTYGHFIRPHEHLCREGLEKWGLKGARRPTGGGITFHIGDFAFSALVPASHPRYSANPLENYRFIHGMVWQAIDAVFRLPGKERGLLATESPSLDKKCRFFCMAQPSKYDLTLGGKKIGGAAERRGKNGFLHQGFISLEPVDRALLEEVLLKNSKVSEAMKRHAMGLLEVEKSYSLAEARHLLKKSLLSQFSTPKSCT